MRHGGKKMAKRKKIGNYLAWGHLLKQESRDFEKLQKQLEEEAKLYSEAARAAYCCIFSKRKVEKVDKCHSRIIEQAKKDLEAYDNLYKKIQEEIASFAPNYRKGEPEYNWKEFRRYCDEFARRYGSWFWNVHYRNDPLDIDWNNGTKTIRQLQTHESNAWYSGGDWDKWFWEDIPYGARLMEFNYNPYHDFVWYVINENHGFPSKPSERLRQLIASN